MANSQTYINGEKVTTLKNVSSHQITIPAEVDDFINKRYSGKLEELFLYNGNASILYSSSPSNYYSGPLTNRLDYKNPLIGQRTRNAIDDTAFITSFLGTTAGTNFLLNQVYLQGFQAFDETKLYNPASAIVASVAPGMFGLLGNPTRHIDTSNVVGGVTSALGLTNIISTVGSLISGDSESNPAPPRSSVASEASGGLSLTTLTSLVGGGDRSDEVVTPIARDGIKGLLRGGTATTAYNSKAYKRLVQSSDSTLLGRLLNSALSFVVSNTAVGSLVNPTQPWDASYRADEQTYDFYLGAGGLFPGMGDGADIPSSNILNSIRNSLGFGESTNYSSAVTLRFYNVSSITPALCKLGNKDYDFIASQYTDSNKANYTSGKIDSVAVYTGNADSEINTATVKSLKTVGNSLKYTQLLSRKNIDGNEVSDILYEYKKYINRIYSPEGEVIRAAGVTQKIDVEKQKKEFYTSKSIKYFDYNLNKDLSSAENEYDYDNILVKKTNSVGITVKSLKDTYNNTLNSAKFYGDAGGYNSASLINSLYSNGSNPNTEKLLNDLSKTAQKLKFNSLYEIDKEKIFSGDALKPIQFVRYISKNIGFTGYGQHFIQRNGSETEKASEYKYTNLYNTLQSDEKMPRLVDKTGNEYNTIPNKETDLKNVRAISPTNKADYINLLTPLNKNEFESKYLNAGNGYGPDLIRFYFYDIVNKKYIPFNAIITQLQDINDADWNSINYIGRADKLFHYSGFSRSIMFNFKVVSHSVYDLISMWKRINYLVSLTRPANYTQLNIGGMIVPPIVQLTLGDYYKNHFVLLRNVNIIIPDDAPWETVPEEKTKDWAYNIANIISPKQNVTVAQFPRVADVIIRMNVLEKDRPRTGYGIWGDAPAIYGTPADRIGESNTRTVEKTRDFDTGWFNNIASTTDKLDIEEAEFSTYNEQEYYIDYANRDFSNKIRTNVNELSVNQSGIVQQITRSVVVTEADGTVTKSKEAEIIGRVGVYDEDGNISNFETVTSEMVPNN